MKTTSETYKESIAEFKNSYCVDRAAQPIRWIRSIFCDDVDQIETILAGYKSHTLAILDSSIERLRGELYENKTSECNCRGWDNGIQKEIDHLTAQKVIIEKL